jgi:hypothetical protein
MSLCLILFNNFLVTQFSGLIKTMGRPPWIYVFCSVFAKTNAIICYVPITWFQHLLRLCVKILTGLTRIIIQIMYNAILQLPWRRLWSIGQGEVLCFVWGTNWIYICYVVVKALCYKPKDRGFDSRWGEFLNLPNLSGRTRPWGLLSL